MLRGRALDAAVELPKPVARIIVTAVAWKATDELLKIAPIAAIPITSRSSIDSLRLRRSSRSL